MLTDREERIVAWLRSLQARKTQEGERLLHESNPIWTASMRTAGFYEMCADAIEAGEHLKRPSPSIPYETWRDEPSVG
jgi:hypothetical protein